MKNFVLLTLIALAMLLALPAQAATSGVSANFTVELQPSAEGAKPISIDGKLLSVTDRLRIETVHPLTMEAVILIADFAKNSALMLYPDTLNGFSTSLAGLDKSGYLTVMRGYLENGKLQLPKDWKSEKLAADKVGGATVQHIRVTTKTGRKVDYWINSDNRVVKLTTGDDSGKLTMNFTDYNGKATAKDSAFTHGKDYVISQIEDPEILLGVVF
jgi:hypothetical protein